MIVRLWFRQITYHLAGPKAESGVLAPRWQTSYYVIEGYVESRDFGLTGTYSMTIVSGLKPVFIERSTNDPINFLFKVVTLRVGDRYHHKVEYWGRVNKF